MSRNTFIVLIVIALCASCVHTPSAALSDPWNKVELDLSAIDQDGLRGPPSGKVSVAYEFSIPNQERCKTEVKAIDPTIQCTPGSSGRVGAGKDDCLCIGHTRKNYREALQHIAELPYVQRIIECFFE